MTNKEVLIQALQNFKGEYEENVTDYLACPYFNYKDCFNDLNSTPYETQAWHDGCKLCKQKWLEKEWEE